MSTWSISTAAPKQMQRGSRKEARAFSRSAAI
jgi:hypothetical protein